MLFTSAASSYGHVPAASSHFGGLQKTPQANAPTLVSLTTDDPKHPFQVAAEIDTFKGQIKLAANARHAPDFMEDTFAVIGKHIDVDKNTQLITNAGHPIPEAAHGAEVFTRNQGAKFLGHVADPINTVETSELAKRSFNVLIKEAMELLKIK
jgi:hypothetical protein